MMRRPRWWSSSLPRVIPIRTICQDATNDICIETVVEIVSKLLIEDCNVRTSADILSRVSVK